MIKKSKSLNFSMLLISFLFVINSANSQSFSDPVSYMNYISEEYKLISKDTWDYTRSVAHGKSANKVEKRRFEMINTVKNALNKIKKLPAYGGDASFRDSVVTFLNINYIVLNQDYAKIVDMEAVAEQSYDLMEAYLMAQELAGEKLSAANEMVNEQQKIFASNNNINLIEGEKSKISKKLENASDVMKYYNQVYLIFFKSYKQEMYLLEAIGKFDVNAIQQNNNSLLKYSNEGKEKIKEIGAYEDDNKLAEEGNSILNYYIDEANKTSNIIIDFIMKKEQFEKVKKSFDEKKQNDRTQEDIDQYNTSVNEMNAAANLYNNTNNELNQQRAKFIQNWNKATSDFLDKHTAH